MRLSGLTLENYGPFQRQALVLDPAPGRINLLVAPNGAGKSVLRRAVGDLLFNIPDRSPMSWLYGTQNMRISARARDASGEVSLIRRKGRGNTLSDGTAPVPAEAVRRLLGSADRRLFEDLFALDSHLLREGGQELCRSSGRLGAMLLAGSGGLGRVRRLLEDLLAARDAIGRAERRHEAQPLWKADKEAIEAGRALQQAALRPEAFLALEKRAAEAAATLASLRSEREAVAAELERLTALKAVRPWLAERDKKRAVLAEAGDVPRLEPGFETRWRRALEEHARATAVAAERARQAAEAEAALQGEPPDTTLLQVSEQIETILCDAVTALNATHHLPGVEDISRRAEREVARLRAELGWDAAVPLPPAAVLRRSRDLVSERASQLADAEAAERELAKARRRRDLVQAELAELPPAEDTAALAALLREIRAAGDPLRRLETAHAARRDAEAQLAAALAALPERALTRAQLAATTAPADATLAACETALAEAEASCRDALRERDTLARERAAEQAALDQLMREAELPAPGALATARAERDRCWDAVSGGSAAAAVAFERALRHADTVADILIAHAAQAAKADALRRRIDDLGARQATAAAGWEAASDARLRAQAELSALAASAGAPSGAVPAALRAFLTARGAALDRTVALDRAKADEEDVAAALERAAQRLAALGLTGDGLAALLESAEARVDAARTGGEARKAALHATRTAERDVQERTLARARARQALELWEASWREAIAPLARPVGETPEATGAALDLVEQLRSQEAELAGARGRIRDMRAAIDGFVADMAALCARVAPDLAGLPPEEAAAQLRQRLRQQHDAVTRREAEGRSRDAAREAATVADAKARACAAELAALRAALGVADDEDAAAQLEQVRRVSAAETELAESRRHILLQGGGRTDAELDALVAAEAPEAEATRIAALAGRQAELGPLIEEAAAEARSAMEALERAGEGDDAVSAAERRQAALAAVGRHAGEALVLHAAASLLRAALEAEQAESGSATVSRIGAVFRALTGGAHAGVAVEDVGSEQVMVALEADGRTTKAIAELSEGTSDQLFLALRLVALQDYVAAAPPLPFIADDVLQTFDDARAVAALRALLDLSAQVQVLVLTHHPHMQALARSLPAGSVHTIVLPEMAEAA